MTSSYPDVGAEARHRIVFADPAWDYQNYGMAKHGSHRAHYGGSPVSGLATFPLRRFCDPAGALLFLWCTGPKGAEGAAFDLARAWGFRPVTRAFTWVKVYPKCRACGADWDAHRPDLHDGRGACRATGCRAFSGKLYAGTGTYTMGGTEDVWLCRSVWGDSTFSKDRARKDIRHSFIHPLPRRAHSAKPETAQERVELLWLDHGPRLELFARRERPGWTAYGLELGQALGPWGVRPVPPRVLALAHVKTKKGRTVPEAWLAKELETEARRG